MERSSCIPATFSFAKWRALSQIATFEHIVGGFIILIGHPASSIVSSLVEMSDLRKRKALYEDSIRRDSLLIENLKNDEFLERYAREKYFMKGQNEDLFIVE